MKREKPQNTARHLNLDLVLNPGIMNLDDWLKVKGAVSSPF
jgi:hypothetical protein